ENCVVVECWRDEMHCSIVQMEIFCMRSYNQYAHCEILKKPEKVLVSSLGWSSVIFLVTHDGLPFRLASGNLPREIDIRIRLAALIRLLADFEGLRVNTGPWSQSSEARPTRGSLLKTYYPSRRAGCTVRTSPWHV